MTNNILPKLKIISGGQTGVDQGSLACAKAHGVQTGGTAPKGWLTEDGAAPWLGEEYSLVKCEHPGYPPRTRQNVIDADLTVLLDLSFLNGKGFGEANYSRGTKLAIKTCEEVKRKYLVNPGPETLVKILDACPDIRIINAAGNRASKQPTAYDFAYDFWGQVFELLKREH